ncbi:hypothetical protein FACS189488_07450 [Betaproteobacteria bacterium]|nr:hypothetical protein FACS189488_07450 [Betaproteobacteria bacterium]
MNTKKSLLVAMMLTVATSMAQAANTESPQDTLAKIFACEPIAETLKPAEVEKLIQSVGAQTTMRSGILGDYTLPTPLKFSGLNATGIFASFGEKPFYIAIVKGGDFQSYIKAQKLQSDKDGEEWVRVTGKRKVIVKGDDEEFGVGCYIQ